MSAPSSAQELAERQRQEQIAQYRLAQMYPAAAQHQLAQQQPPPQQQQPPATQQQDLWVIQVDPQTGRRYYLNQQTNEARWM